MIKIPKRIVSLLNLGIFKMEKISIIYAYRNREISRIKASIMSLKIQNNKSFEVIFVDYGSEIKFSKELKKLFEKYSFINYHYLDVEKQLWNKSKALNFGIKNANGSHIFIADVDLIFHPRAVNELLKKISLKDFFLFRMGYLDQAESSKLSAGLKFAELKPKRFGEVNGMILAAKESFFEINGYDEFFHFYGSEDVDLYSRLTNAGYQSHLVMEVYFYHNWHVSYELSDYNKLSKEPRLSNAIRLNEQHYLYQKREKILRPDGQQKWGDIPNKTEIEALELPTLRFEKKNILAQVEHFFYREIRDIENEVVEVKITEDEYFNSFKYKVKKALKKSTQTYCTMKDVNDIILKQIIFLYRNYNYSYVISPDLKSITFKIQL